jgi:rubrerythrin
MARITRVKKAQQRYQTVPVLNEDGSVKKVPVMNRRTGEQKVSKRGPVFQTVTVKDKTKPLPMPTCDYGKCDHPSRTIQPGEPYMHITPKSGPYGGRTLYRHGNHPGWNVWDYSHSLSAQVARISSDYEDAVLGADEESTVQDALQAMADEVRDLAEQRRESASNIEEGFGHATYQSEELEQQAEDLDGWADELENADVPALSDYECDTCSGIGQVAEDEDEDDTCPDCDGSGQDVDAWRDAVESEVTAPQECPV